MYVVPKKWEKGELKYDLRKGERDWKPDRDDEKLNT